MDLAKVKEQKAAVKVVPEVEEVVWEWPDVYYATTDAQQRKAELKKAIEKGLEPEENKIRMEMWKQRYSSKPGVDTMLAAFINLMYFANIVKSDNKARRRKKEVQEIFDTLQLDIADKYGKLGEELLYLEHYHMVDFYLNLCKNDRKYCSLLFGVGTMSAKKVKEKMAGEIYTVCYGVPQVIGGDERYQIFRKAAVDAFAMSVPSHEQLLLHMINNQGAHPVEEE